MERGKGSPMWEEYADEESGPQLMNGINTFILHGPPKAEVRQAGQEEKDSTLLTDLISPPPL